MKARANGAHATAECELCRDAVTRVVVLELLGDDAHVVDADGHESVVAIDFLPGVRVGEALLVRLGVALAREPAKQGERS
ncbi:MAG: hydrogenase maturation protein [Phycisphaerae bacterium]|nr:hydrogenase maturation protein [Phycisphaerae bacterium]